MKREYCIADFGREHKKKRQKIKKKEKRKGPQEVGDLTLPAGRGTIQNILRRYAKEEKQHPLMSLTFNYKSFGRTY